MAFFISQIKDPQCEVKAGFKAGDPESRGRWALPWPVERRLLFQAEGQTHTTSLIPTRSRYLPVTFVWGDREGKHGLSLGLEICWMFIGRVGSQL